MSAVRVTKIRDFDVTPPRKSAFQIETPPDVPRQHSLTIFSALPGAHSEKSSSRARLRIDTSASLSEYRIVASCFCQTGDIIDGTGTGGESIYGLTMEDETFELGHTLPGEGNGGFFNFPLP